MSGQYPTYEVFIDWDGDRGLRLADFELNYEGWTAGGTTPPTLALSTDQFYAGSQSLLVSWVAFNPFVFNDADAGFNEGRFGTWEFENSPTTFTFNDADRGFDEGRFAYNEISDPTATSPYIAKTITGLTVGATYTLSLRAYATGAHVHASIEGLADTNSTTSFSTWTELTCTFTANATSHVLRVDPDTEPAGGETMYVDYVFVMSEFEDITDRTLAKRHSISFSYGRDSSRALSPVSPAETDLEVLNRDAMFAPDNATSPLAGKVMPGREVLVRATHSSRAYDLFRGFLDNLDVDPATGTESVTFAVSDVLSYLGATDLSTEVYRGKRTGELIDIILDEIDWPSDKRDLDAGATVVNYWWEEGSDAVDAINRLVASEGPPAYVTVSSSGDFVFRDRHHRLLSDASTTSQVTFTSNGDEPQFSPPMSINVGWKDILNSVTIEVSKYQAKFEHAGEGVRPVIWETEETFVLQNGESRVITALANDAFIDAQVPSDARETEDDDYALLSGTVSVSLSRTSGQSTDIIIRCTSGPAIVQGMKLRAAPIVKTEGSEKVTVKNLDSISSMNREITHTIDAPWANFNDCYEIALIILGQRANRLPTVSITLNNGTSERMTQILQRDLSDRVTIMEPRSYTNHDFFVESIEHTIAEAGKFHEAVLGCERIPTYDTVPFRFNDTDAGFGEGCFGYDGLSEASTVFVLDESLLDQGLLGF